METNELPAEHRWLHRWVGDWTFEGEAPAGEGQPPARLRGTEHVGTLGELWIVCEGRTEGPDGSALATMLTVGFEPGKGRFVATFIASTMAELWLYEGTLDPSREELVLETTGPDLEGRGETVPYRDVHRFVNDDLHTVTSQARAADGSWVTFMTAEYRRVRRESE